MPSKNPPAPGTVSAKKKNKKREKQKSPVPSPSTTHTNLQYYQQDPLVKKQKEKSKLPEPPNPPAPLPPKAPPTPVRQKNRFCKGCRKELEESEKDKTYCTIKCYRAHVKRSSKKTCKHCGGKYTPTGGSRQQYCGDACGQEARKLLEIICPNCLEPFVPKRGKQEYCGYKCSNGADKTKEKKVAKKKAPKKGLGAMREVSRSSAYERKPSSTWTMKDYWDWVYDSLYARRVSVLRPLGKKEWAQLKYLHEDIDHGNGQRGVKLDKLIDVTRVLIRKYPAYQREFDWKDDTFTPGMLLGYWHSVESRANNKDKGSFASITREWDGNYQPLQQPDVPQETYGLPAPAVEEEEHSDRQWKTLAREEWTAKVLWEYIYDRLQDKHVPVVSMRRKGEKKLKELIEKEGSRRVAVVAGVLVREYRDLKEQFSWTEPFRPEVFVGFWSGLIKYLRRENPDKLREIGGDKCSYRRKESR